MTLEALRCTNCGSQNVDEVKRGTYFCQHCETVFRYVDPSRVTVTHEQAFCECGNAVEFQCYLCRTGICGDHDVFDGGQKTGEGVAAFVAERAGAMPPHLCGDCLKPLMSELRTMREERRRCRELTCIRETATACACCDGAFCEHHAGIRTFVARWGTEPGDAVSTTTGASVCDECTRDIGRALGLLQPAPARASRRFESDVRAEAGTDARNIIGRVATALSE